MPNGNKVMVQVDVKRLEELDRLRQRNEQMEAKKRMAKIQRGLARKTGPISSGNYKGIAKSENLKQAQAMKNKVEPGSGRKARKGLTNIRNQSRKESKSIIKKSASIKDAKAQAMKALKKQYQQLITQGFRAIPGLIPTVVGAIAVIIALNIAFGLGHIVGKNEFSFKFWQIAVLFVVDFIIFFIVVLALTLIAWIADCLYQDGYLDWLLGVYNFITKLWWYDLI